MDYAYTYGDPSRLYLNVTNRCTNRCSFCVRYATDGLGGASLWHGPEPDIEDLVAAIEDRGGPGAFREFIWCGFGEPTYRLDLIARAAVFLRSGGARIRLNTNGHGCLIHGRDILPELARAVDMVSVSLNAPNRERYLELCRPGGHEEAPSPAHPRRTDGEGGAGDRSAPGRETDLHPPDRYWDAVLDFIRRAPQHFEMVQASVVGFALSQEEIRQAEELAAALGAHRFRVR